MRDHDDRAAPHQPVQCLDDEVLRLRVQRRGRLVQYEDGAVADDGPRNGNSLSLTAGQGIAVLSHQGIVATRHSGNELVGICYSSRGNDFLFGRFGSAIGDILAKFEPGNSTVSCMTKAICDRSAATLQSAISTPSIRIWPSFGS